jgi:hypothetical protein
MEETGFSFSLKKVKSFKLFKNEAKIALILMGLTFGFAKNSTDHFQTFFSVVTEVHFTLKSR